MLHLCYSNRLEVLAAPLCAAVAHAQAAEPFLPITVVVPNHAVAQFLQFRVAEGLGVAAHLKFVFLQRFLSNAIERARPGLHVLDKDALQLLLYARVRDQRFLDAHGLDTIDAYIGHGDTSVQETRALALCGELARLFEEYGYSRRAMLKAWRQGPTLAQTPWASTEAWQRRLWSAIFDEHGASRVQGAQLDLFGHAVADPTPGTARWMLLPDAFAATARQLDLPETLHVFGLSYVAPAFAEIFAGLAERTALHVYAQNPCLEFWEDVDTSATAQKLARDSSQWAHRADRIEDTNGEDPFQLMDAADTPALRLWGRPGRAYVRLLNQLTACRFAPGFVDPVALDGDRLLTRLQRDVLLRAPFDTASATRMDAPDGSVRFLACPGVRRAVEIVADEIWSLLDADETGIRLHEIAVMVTSRQADAYLTHIADIFRARGGLPFNIIDGRLSAQSGVPEAIERLLNLPLGPFGVDEVMAFLTHRTVGGAMGADLDRWRRWSKTLNVRFGLDAQDHEGTYLNGRALHWRQATERLTLGAFMTGPRSGDETPFQSDEASWLPLECGHDALRDQGLFVDIIERLRDDTRACRTSRLTVTDWARYMSRLVSTYVIATEPSDERALGRCLSALEALAATDLERTEVSYATVHTLISGRFTALDAERGQHQVDGVVVSSLLPMRAIPFKAVFVLGLDEGAFPAQSRAAPLDLRQARRQAGDVSPSERDRYLFLETLLAARTHLTLAYVSRDAQTGDAVAPSAVIQELQYILRGYLSREALDQMTTVHPVSPTDHAYTDGRLRSWSEPAAQATAAQALGGSLREHLGAPPPPLSELMAKASPEAQATLTALVKPPAPAQSSGALSDEMELSLSAIWGFLESPLQGAARFALGLSDDEAPPEDEADEPLWLAPSERASLLRDTFWSAGGQPDAISAAYEAGFVQHALTGAAPQGPFADAQRHHDLTLLNHWCDELKALDLGDLEGWLQVRMGRADAFATADHVFTPTQLEIPREGAAPLRVRLRGQLWRWHPQQLGTIRCLGHALDTPGAFAREALRGFVQVAALSASGAWLPPQIQLACLPSNPTGGHCNLSYLVPPADVARAWLTDVVGDLLGGPHSYRMPLDALLDWRNKRQWSPGLPFTGGFAPWTFDKYGPVRDPINFPPPSLEEAQAWSERRLGLWFKCQERWS